MKLNSVVNDTAKEGVSKEVMATLELSDSDKRVKLEEAGQTNRVFGERPSPVSTDLVASKADATRRSAELTNSTGSVSSGPSELISTDQSSINISGVRPGLIKFYRELIEAYKESILESDALMKRMDQKSAEFCREMATRKKNEMHDFHECDCRNLLTRDIDWNHLLLSTGLIPEFPIPSLNEFLILPKDFLQCSDLGMQCSD